MFSASYQRYSDRGWGDGGDGGWDGEVGQCQKPTGKQEKKKRQTGRTLFALQCLFFHVIGILSLADGPLLGLINHTNQLSDNAVIFMIEF